MLQHVLAPDVEDERQTRLQSHDVGEVLLRPDPQVDPVGLHHPLQGGNDFLKSGFVGKKIVGAEVSSRLRHVGDQIPELAVGELAGKGLAPRTGTGGSRDPYKKEYAASPASGPGHGTKLRQDLGSRCRYWRQPIRAVLTTRLSI